MELQSQAQRHDERLLRRLETLVPGLMERADLDVWVVAGREYNEDPVLATMLPAEWLGTARRRTILVFIRREGAVERLAVARYAVGDLFPPAWDPVTQPDQWARAAEFIGEADPRRIGIDVSPSFALADGLSSTEHDRLVAALPPHLRTRIVSAEMAAIGWLETRTPEEVDIMREACGVAHDMLRRALSSEVIRAGETTTKEVEWWLRGMVRSAGHGDWFHPTCSVQRPGESRREGFATAPAEEVVQTGDLVHIDFGIVYDGYCTDQQQHGYVPRPGEKEAPEGLTEGLGLANRLQDVLMGEFVTGRTGNQILAAARDRAAREGIDGLIYTHPLGMHGHAAGPTIGLWDRQEAIPGAGDYPLWPDTCHSIELMARHPVVEWDGKIVQFMLEEDAWFDGRECLFLEGRQTEIWVI
ncbi:MAG: M24 family metallopeptidase [Actinobacteria bacterium]|nr:M24 family metallopeptidase [Actinomycetota bacterium]